MPARTAVEQEVEAPGDQQQDEQAVAERARIGQLERRVGHAVVRQRPLEPKHALRHQACGARTADPEDLKP